MTDESAKRVVARFQLEAMSNLRPDDTGVLGAIIWVSAGEFAGADAQHGPRIKVMQGSKRTTEGLRDAISVQLTDPPEVLGVLPGKLKKQVIAFVNANREVLLRYWAFEIGTPEMVRLLQRV
jgi:hypothetical protein